MIAPIIALAAAAWLCLLVAAPLLPVPAAAVLYAVGSHICHQRPERSFHLAAVQLPVCARCLGIYAGAATGSMLALLPRFRFEMRSLAPRMLLVAGAIPTAVTLVLEWSGAWGVTNVVRAAAGLFLGCAVAVVVAQAAATVHYGRCALRRPIANSRPPTPI